jgi:hypothetical protein
MSVGERVRREKPVEVDTAKRKEAGSPDNAV